VTFFEEGGDGGCREEGREREGVDGCECIGGVGEL
jgi:hypothetical protein